MKTGRFILAALAAAIFSFFFGWLTCGWLFRWIYLLPPPGIFRAMENVALTYWVIFNIGNFITALIYTFAYSKIGYVFGGGVARKGLLFGCFIWLVSLLPGMFFMYMTTNVGWQLSVYWLVRGFAELAVVGLLIALIYPLSECECCK